jgi:hypothetical protein
MCLCVCVCVCVCVCKRTSSANLPGVNPYHLSHRFTEAHVYTRRGEDFILRAHPYFNGKTPWYVMPTGGVKQTD